MTYRTPTVVAGTSGAAAGDIQITRPAALRVGDLVVLVVASEILASDMTVPEGFTAILGELSQGQINARAWYKFATNSEPATYDVSFAEADAVLYNLFILRGADPFTVIEAVDSAVGNAGLPIAEPGVTTAVDNCLAVAVLAVDGAPRVLVQPTGWTLLESRDGSAGTLSMAIATKGLTSAGGSGGGNWTATDSMAADYAAITFAVRPGVMSLSNSILYEPQQLLAKTLADCSEFRNLVGAPDHASALARIWHESLPRPAGGRESYTLAELQAYRPFALIFTNDLDGAMATRQASLPGAWADRGSLRIVFEIDTPETLKNSPVLLDQLVKQTIGRIQKRPADESSSTFFGLADLAGRTNEAGGYSYLAADTVAFRGYRRSNARDEPGQGDYLYAWLEVLYGQRG